MNKSLAFRNRIYRFCFLLFSFFLFFYLLFFLIKGDRGILSYYKILNKKSLINEKIISLKNINNNLEDKISRLSPNTLDLDYLDEQVRIQTGKNYTNELVVKLDQ